EKHGRVRGDAPKWSPDGTRLAFALKTGGDPHIYVDDAAGPSARKLVTSPNAYDGSPAWSPDGKRIAFGRRGPDHRHYRIYVIDSPQPNEPSPAWDQNLVEGPPGFEPDWDPDGRFIVYSRAGDLWTARPDGSGRTHLFSTDTVDSNAQQPVWSPSGDKI